MGPDNYGVSHSFSDEKACLPNGVIGFSPTLKVRHNGKALQIGRAWGNRWLAWLWGWISILMLSWWTWAATVLSARLIPLR